MSLGPCAATPTRRQQRRPLGLDSHFAMVSDGKRFDASRGEVCWLRALTVSISSGRQVALDGLRYRGTLLLSASASVTQRQNYPTSALCPYHAPVLANEIRCLGSTSLIPFVWIKRPSSGSSVIASSHRVDGRSFEDTLVTGILADGRRPTARSGGLIAGVLNISGSRDCQRRTSQGRSAGGVHATVQRALWASESHST